MNENLLTIEKRSSINGTFWKKRLINDSLDTDKITDSKLNSILETILYGRNIKKEDFDNFLDPKAFYKGSLIGVPGLFKAYRKGNVAILNAPGTGFADDKLIYSYIPEIIKYYLGEDPKLQQVETFRCFEKNQCDHVIENIGQMVVKPADGSGGYGIMIGPKAKLKERNIFRKRIMDNPRNYIAQPLEILSTTPTLQGDLFEPRHQDLRPFILSGRDTYVTMGGLTRVALKKGSTIVNSSRGGGSKDTLIVE